jgi:uncharacterized protein (TIGR03437 family)
MKRSVRRYPLALLFSLLLLSGFTSFTSWAHQALGSTISKSANYLRQALTQPANPGDQGAIAKPVQQPNDSTETALEPAQGNFTIPQNVLPGGGGVSTGGTNTLLGTIGQGIVGTSSGGNFTLSGGFLGAVDQCPTITISPATLANGQLGQPYSRQLTQSGGTGQIMWSISAGNLPNNVTLNPSTGLLSGLPVASGSFPFTVRAADASGCAGTQNYTLVINSCPVITIMPGSLPAATAGLVYNQTLTASDGTPPYSFSINTGTVPLNLSTSGALSGTPPLGGSFPFTVRVTDASGCTGAQSYTLTVNAGTFTASGRVVDLMGKGIADVTVAFSSSAGGLGSVQTDANGNWTRPGFATLPDQSACTANPYVARPSKSGYSFTPSSLTFCAGSTPLNFTGVLVVTSVSATSFLGQELAQESIIAAFGSNLATKVEIATTTPLPTTLAGTTVKVKDSAGTERNAPLFFVAPGQINYQMPPGTAVGQATVMVTSGDNTISVGNVTVSRVVPGLFTANASGQGVPAAVVLRIRNGVQIFEAVSRFDAAQGGFVPAPIDLGPASDVVYLLLYGGGVRNRTRPENISVNLGGVVKSLNLANFEDGFAASGFVGLDQINVLLPRSLAGQGNINVTVTVDGKPSNTVQLNIR